METSTINQFIDSWGSMGSSWGVNRSVARVHGLLIVSDRPWCPDEIADYLQLSKGNVRTCLKELLAWNVIQKVVMPGDRREFYSCVSSVWEMIFSILRERKKKEFDPLVASVTQAHAETAKNTEGIDVERLAQMKQMLDTFDSIAEKMLSNETVARALISLLAGRT
jgi:DNA-binding transcriptional regulator GbsR (MarR family)